MSDERKPKESPGPIKGRITWQTSSGWQISEDCELTPLRPVLDARAVHEGRTPRFGFDPNTYRELQHKCESAGEKLPQEVIEGFNRLLKSRKIQVFAAKEPDGRVEVSLCTRPEDKVPQETVEDYGRLLELLSHLQPGRIYTPEAQERLRQLIRERFPTLSKVKADRLLEATWEVLREPRAWQEDMPPEERRPYFATSAWHALGKQPVHPDPKFQTKPLPPDDKNKEDPKPRPQWILYLREMAEKARSLKLRPGEREILELILTGRANSWLEARRMAGLPDSYRVGLLKKLKALAG